MKKTALVVLIGFFLLANTAGAQTERTIYTFNCATDGCVPLNGLTWDADQRNLYGATSNGGANGQGTIFELTYSKKKGWQYQVLFSFNHGSDGNAVNSSLTYYKGALYGATWGVGDPHCGCGTVFELKKVKGVWTYTVLHTFTGGTADGAFAYGGVILDAKGNIYGTTKYGGSSIPNCSIGCGTVYELSKIKGNWDFKLLASLSGQGDIAEPLGTLAMDAAGNLYGTGCCGGNGGGVFELSPAGGGTWNYQDWFLFDGTTTGDQPNAGVILDSKGNLYGTVLQAATAFELSAPQSYAILYNQGSTVESYAPLVLDDAGNLYGTTYTYGDGQGDGTVFELASPGFTPSVLHIFQGPDGSGIQTPVTLDKKGNIYGTATLGGGHGTGLIYEITP